MWTNSGLCWRVYSVLNVCAINTFSWHCKPQSRGTLCRLKRKSCYGAQVWCEPVTITLYLRFVMLKMLLTWTCERVLVKVKGET